VSGNPAAPPRPQAGARLEGAGVSEKFEEKQMGQGPKIVSISGTSRPGNYTSMALAVVNDELRARGVTPTLIEARDIQLPFPGQGDTEDALALRSAVEAASAVVFATPEYHGGFSAMTKLIIENLGYPSAMAGKPVALLGVAAGRIGAIKSLEQLRSVCSHTGAIVLPGSVSIAGVRSAFDEDGTCLEPGTEGALRRLADSLLAFIKDFVCPKHTLESLVRGGEIRAWTSTV
jgi:chromate reductase